MKSLERNRIVLCYLNCYYFLRYLGSDASRVNLTSFQSLFNFFLQFNLIQCLVSVTMEVFGGMMQKKIKQVEGVMGSQVEKIRKSRKKSKKS